VTGPAPLDPEHRDLAAGVQHALATTSAVYHEAIIARAIADAEQRGREERGAVVDAIGEALVPDLVRAFAGLDLMPGSTLRLTDRAAERFARFAVDTLLAAVPGGGSPRDG
jgi:hypothetical protein